MKSAYVIAVVLIIIIVGSVVAYTYLSSPSSTANVTLNASGATFPQPFLNAAIISYESIKPNVQINYQGGGSGKGVNDLTNKIVEFACSDAALTDSQRSAAPNIVHIPETIGAITIGYNLPGISSGLKLTGNVLADIYLGTVTKWNDPAIIALNPDLALPDQNIAVVHRSDGSGTTKWFTTYLSMVSNTWGSQIGANTTVQWPAGTGQSGNSAVAAIVTSTQYSIGYIELSYALQNHVPVAALQNPAGNFVLPSLDSTTAAAASIPTSGLPSGDQSWANVAILNAPGAQAYPIVNPTYMLIYKDLSVVYGMTLEEATAVVQFIWYVVHDGQQQANALNYAALPSNIVTIDETTLNSITFNGQAIPTH